MHGARWLAVAGAGLATAAPFLAPALTTELGLLWIMVVFALSWDILGGQMGYTSFGNVLFLGLGMYATALMQRDSGLSYYPALLLGLGAGALITTLLAAILGSGMLGLRGHYFAIGTLGLGIAAGEIASSWDYVGAGGGLTVPIFPGDIHLRTTFFYYPCLLLAAATFLALRRVYRSRLGLALNAIRDDEDKAEAMGLHTTRYKAVAWCISAFFLAIAGGLLGNILGFIDPRDTAFAGATYGLWMVVMPILGGRGTLWGPVLGAAIFHVAQELFWTYLLGWQRVAMGALIIVVVVFFPQGILGWARQRWPARFEGTVDETVGRAGRAGR